MDQQISFLVKGANFYLYRLGKIRRYLTTSATKILVHCFVISRFDYANPLYAALPMTKLKLLQAVQDVVARLILRDTIPAKEVMFHLYCLPIQLRIDFKILLFIFDCLRGAALVYLQSAIEDHTMPSVNPFQHQVA